MRLIVWLGAAAIVAGCAVRHPAPVTERAPSVGKTAKPAVAPVVAPVPARAPDPRPEFYTVKRGDTLYSIALDHGFEYREVAEWNQISDPNVIRVGQVLRMRAPAEAAASAGAAQSRPVAIAGEPESRPLGEAAQPRVAAGAAQTVKTEPRAYKLPYSAENVALMARGEAPRPDQKPEPKPEIKPEPRPNVVKQEPVGEDEEKVEWGWPAAGRVIAGFSDPSSKGLNLAGKIGDPVLASASGRVVYSGAGLRGYGKLVIIKHNKTFLTAYAHNNQILVKEGQNVIKGQKIAEIGNTDAEAPGLHFEIRRLGKPVDPLKFLPERPS